MINFRDLICTSKGKKASKIKRQYLPGIGSILPFLIVLVANRNLSYGRQRLTFQQGLASSAIFKHSSSSRSTEKILANLSTDIFTAASPMVAEQPKGGVPA